VRLQKKSTFASEPEFVKILNVETLNFDLQDAILALGKIRLIAVEDSVGDILIELSESFFRQSINHMPGFYHFIILNAVYTYAPVVNYFFRLLIV
jgi:hypothetical protein